MADKNEKPNVSRRDMFQILGAVPAVAAVATGDHAHMHMAPEPVAAAKGPYKRQTFDDHQWKTVNVLCDLIIPADERSVSASAAGVPEFMDDWIQFRTDQDGHMHLRAEIFGGWMCLH